MTDTLTLAIVDDDKLVVQLLCDFFSQDSTIEVSFTAFSGNEFIARLQELEAEPDIVLLDLRMNDGDGMAVIEKVQADYPKIRIVVLSSFCTPAHVGFMMRSGVHAFLPKETDKDELLSLIHRVKINGYYFSPEQMEALKHQLSGQLSVPVLFSKNALSSRELEVLFLVCQQLTAKEIALKLFVSVKTIESHRSNLLLKTGTKNTAGLILYAIQNNLIDPKEFITNH